MMDRTLGGVPQIEVISVGGVDPLRHIFCELARRPRRLHQQAAVGYIGRELPQRAAYTLFDIGPIERRPAQQPVSMDRPVARAFPYGDRIKTALGCALLHAVIPGASRVLPDFTEQRIWLYAAAGAELNSMVSAVSIGDSALRANRSACSSARALSGRRHVLFGNRATPGVMEDRRITAC